jgi:hypothetical protein
VRLERWQCRKSWLFGWMWGSIFQIVLFVIGGEGWGFQYVAGVGCGREV